MNLLSTPLAAQLIASPLNLITGFRWDVNPTVAWALLWSGATLDWIPTLAVNAPITQRFPWDYKVIPDQP